MVEKCTGRFRILSFYRGTVEVSLFMPTGITSYSLFCSFLHTFFLKYLFLSLFVMAGVGISLGLLIYSKESSKS